MLHRLLLESPSPPILCVLAHADDESLVAGGLLARVVEAQGRAKVFVLCGRDSVRRDELAAACSVLGVDWECGDLMDAELTAADRSDVVKRLVALIRREEPAVVVTHDPDYDYNSDHLLLADWTRFACQKAGMSAAGHRPELLISGEVNIPIPFPDYLVDVSAQLPKTIEALERHRSQLEAAHKRGYYTRLLADRCRWRGAQAGCEAAMAFRRLALPVIGNVYAKSPVI
jgi:LmbE family N-acetylglucosaminyl deacetylase